jgi:hypothetical protein
MQQCDIHILIAEEHYIAFCACMINVADPIVVLLHSDATVET